MSAIGFLLIAVVVAVVGSLFVVVRSREENSPAYAMDEFKREMQALAPNGEQIAEPRASGRFPFRPDDGDE